MVLIGAVTHTTVNGFSHGKFSRGNHTWVLVSRGSGGYTRKAISQGKTNVTQFSTTSKFFIQIFLSPFFLFSSNWVCFTYFGRTLSEHPRNSSIISKNSKDSLPRPFFLLFPPLLYLSLISRASNASRFAMFSKSVTNLLPHRFFFLLILLLELFRFSWWSLYTEIRILTSVASHRLFTCSEPEPEESDGLSQRAGLSS